MNGELRELRLNRLMTQKDLASKVGLTVTAISRLETGKSKPRLRTIRALAHALGVPPETLRKMFENRQLPLGTTEP